MRTAAILVAALCACGGARAPDPHAVSAGDDVDPPPRGRAVAASRRAPPSSAATAPRIRRRPAPPRRWTGRPIDINVNNADLHNVFRLLADVAGVSIVVADDVRGSITLRLRGVPWDQALHAIVQLERLRLERDGTIYIVTRRH